MKWLKAFLKKIFNFFSNPNKGPIQNKQVAEQKSSFFGKKKKEVIHRIPPNFSIMPPSLSYKRGIGRIQEIVMWDGECFPGRWRTKLIHHK